LPATSGAGILANDNGAAHLTADGPVALAKRNYFLFALAETLALELFEAFLALALAAGFLAAGMSRLSDLVAVET
jgi:hypothetical protein